MSIISDAVAHLKADAMDRAEQEAREMIEKGLAELEAVEWNLDLVAGAKKKSAYSIIASPTNKGLFLKSITTYTAPTRKASEPEIVKKSEAAESRFIERAKEDAAAQYDKFVAKLESKIGAVKSAQLEGNHIWGYSFLTVEKADGEREIWKTQMIVNCSKLGNLFNQFPTRKVKKAI